MKYQTAGKCMGIYFGRFLTDGGCGYVLNSNYLRYGKANTPSTTMSGKLSSMKYASKTPQILHIKVSNGDCDEVRTKTIDHSCKTFKGHISFSGWINFSSFLGENPQFNERFEFEIAFPELTMIRFVVRDDDSLDDDFIGQFTLLFDCVQPGQRVAWRTWWLVKSSYPGAIDMCISTRWLAISCELWWLEQQIITSKKAVNGYRLRCARLVEAANAMDSRGRWIIFDLSRQRHRVHRRIISDKTRIEINQITSLSSAADMKWNYDWEASSIERLNDFYRWRWKRRKNKKK